jgi:hypothetical protein
MCPRELQEEPEMGTWAPQKQHSGAWPPNRHPNRDPQNSRNASKKENVYKTALSEPSIRRSPQPTAHSHTAMAHGRNAHGRNHSHSGPLPQPRSQTPGRRAREHTRDLLCVPKWSTRGQEVTQSSNLRQTKICFVALPGQYPLASRKHATWTMFHVCCIDNSFTYVHL